MFGKISMFSIVSVAWVVGCGGAVEQDPLEARTLPASQPEATRQAGSGAADGGAPDTPAAPSAADMDADVDTDAGARASDGGAAAPDGTPPTADAGTSDDDCPATRPVAGTACVESASFCGWADGCGFVIASCPAGVWVVSAPPGCDGGGLPEGA